jgi:hypothetical protein
MGMGMNGDLAAAMGYAPFILNCTGTSQTTAAPVRTKNAELLASASNTGAMLIATAKVGSSHFCFNSSATAAVIYVPTGQYLNSTQNGTFTLAVNKAASFLQYKANYWSSSLTA